MKIEVVDDESGQLGEYVKELSDLIAARDSEIAEAISTVEQKYSIKIDDLMALIDNIKKMMS